MNHLPLRPQEQTMSPTKVRGCPRPSPPYGGMGEGDITPFRDIIPVRGIHPQDQFTFQFLHSIFVPHLSKNHSMRIWIVDEKNCSSSRIPRCVRVRQVIDMRQTHLPLRGTLPKYECTRVFGEGRGRAGVAVFYMLYKIYVSRSHHRKNDA